MEAVLRIALLAFVSIIVILVALSFSPEKQVIVPDTDIHLSNAKISLFPDAKRDPNAVWRFEARSLDYNPNTKESELRDIYDGQRIEDGVVDFTLVSNALTIDNRDNIISDEMYIHLIEANWDLDMFAKGGKEVLIDQSLGKFFVPLLEYRGDGIGETVDENVSMKFDLTEFKSGGEGTIGRNSFIDEGQN